MKEKSHPMLDDPFISQMYQHPIFIREIGNLTSNLKPIELGSNKNFLSNLFAVIGVAGWLLASLSNIVNCPTCSPDRIFFSQGASVIFILVVGIGLAASLVTDFLYFLLPVGELRKQIVGAEFDLLRLTPIGEGQIIQAKYAVARMRAASLADIEWALRMAGIVILCIALLFSVIGAPLLLFVGGFALFYFAELTARVNLLTALGLVVGTYTKNYRLAFVLGITAILLMHVMWIVFPLAMLIAAQIQSPEMVGLGMACICFGLLVLVIQVAFVFPSGQRFLLDWAVKNLCEG